MSDADLFGPALNPAQVEKVVEAALLVSPEALPLARLKSLFDLPMTHDFLLGVLDVIRARWQDRALELTEVAGGWRFQSRPGAQVFLERLRDDKPPRYSRAVLETLAVIAYHQPVTRGDIERVRGVSVATQVIRALEARGWVAVIGTRNVPGRPALYATTSAFLDDLGLRSLAELPPLEGLAALASDPDTGRDGHTDPVQPFSTTQGQAPTTGPASPPPPMQVPHEV